MTCRASLIHTYKTQTEPETTFIHHIWKTAWDLENVHRQQTADTNTDFQILLAWMNGGRGEF